MRTKILEDRLNGLRLIADQMISLLNDCNQCDHEDRRSDLMWSEPGHAGSTFMKVADALFVAVSVQFPELITDDVVSIRNQFFGCDQCWLVLKDIITDKLSERKQ